MAPAAPAPLSVVERDLRLDLFRGAALWGIFLDHIPRKRCELAHDPQLRLFKTPPKSSFLFPAIPLLSSTAGPCSERGFLVASARILRRAWQIYVAHIFLFTIFMAEIAYVAATFDNPLYAEEMKILDFLKQPDVTIFEALILKFKPVNMDVLPLYIVLLVLFPPMLLLLIWQPAFALAGSALLYVMAWSFDLNLPAYPNGSWFFNPFAWQLLFVFGAWCALGGAERLAGVLRSRIVLAIAVAYIVFAFAITADLVHRTSQPFRAELAQRLDVSNRQNQSRRFALCAFPRARDRNGALRAA